MAGKIRVDIDARSAAAGGSIRGTITFTGGKRAQNIAGLLVWLTRGPGESAPLGGKVAVTGELSAEPGGVYTFPFELPIPQLDPCQRQLYRVWGSADIPGEIDKHGQSGNFEVT